MLVCSGIKKHIVTNQSLVTSYNVRIHKLKRVTHVWIGVYIWECRREIKFIRHGWRLFLLYLLFHLKFSFLFEHHSQILEELRQQGRKE